jgi:hypothetical protein
MLFNRIVAVRSIAGLVVVFLARQSNAQCPANLSVTGPDANGAVTITASTTGPCNGSRLVLWRDGLPLIDQNCSLPTCSVTTYDDAKCLSPGSHNVTLKAFCTTGTQCEMHDTIDGLPNVGPVITCQKRVG